MTALFFGISTAFWFGTAMYTMAAVSMVVLTRQASASPPPPDESHRDDAADEAEGDTGTLVGASA